MKVGTFGADAIVLDLEDAVADAEKDAARTMVRDALGTYDERTVVVVRVNGPDTGRLEDDIAPSSAPALDCIMVPKVERPRRCARSTRCSRRSSASGASQGTIRLLALIETAQAGSSAARRSRAGARAARDARSSGSATSRSTSGSTSRPTRPSCSTRAHAWSVAARAAGLPPPIDGPVSRHPRTSTGSSRTRCARAGSASRAASWSTRPGGARAARLLGALRRRGRAGCGESSRRSRGPRPPGSASIQVDGRFVDYPIYYGARSQACDCIEAPVEPGPPAA